MHPFVARWRNFHSFRDTGDVEIRPITVLLGPNNSGKTSLIRPLLLLKQTALTRRRAPALVTRGDYADCGDYRDLVPFGQIRRNLDFDLIFHPHDPSRLPPPRERGADPPGEFRVVFGSRRFEPTVHSYAVRDIYGRRVLRRQQSSPDRYSLEDLPAQRSNADGNPFERRLRQLIRTDVPEHFLFRGYPIFSAALTEDHRRGHHAPAEQDTLDASSYASRYLRIADYTYSRVRTLLDSIKYIGPLREPARRIYELTGQPSVDVGVRGQNAPELIFRRGETALNELNTWLVQFGLPGTLEFAELPVPAYSLGFRYPGSDRLVNLTDMGFGLSQVLPLIVQVLGSDPGDVIVAEQPEIHLNPRLQGVLANLFLCAIQRKAGVIVETHSEHLLARFRRMVADGSIDPEDLAVYFVEKRESYSRIREIKVDRRGRIDVGDWPRGFFDDSLREAVALAEVQAGGGPRGRRARAE